MIDHPAGPIILIGAARSGTKFLRDILASGHGVCAVPYDINYVWRHGGKALPHDQWVAEDATAEQRCFIPKAVYSLAKCKTDDVLIEKTVSNTLRVKFVNEIFPNARYVHLIRDGRDVTESAMRQWKAPPNWKALVYKLFGMPSLTIPFAFEFLGNFIKGLASKRKGGQTWGPKFPGIERISTDSSLAEVCALQWMHSVERAVEDLKTIPTNRVFEIRYEDLISSDIALKKLINDLNLPNQDTILKTWKLKVSPDYSELWKMLSKEDQKTMGAILYSALHKLGYI